MKDGHRRESGSERSASGGRIRRFPDPATPGSGDVFVTPDRRQERGVYPLAGAVATYGHR